MLVGTVKRIFKISVSDAGLAVEKSRSVAGGEGKCGDTVLKSADRERERERERETKFGYFISVRKKGRYRQGKWVRWK